MADGLLGGLLGYGNRLRSNLRGLLGDPVTYANEALGNALPSMDELAAQARQMGQTGQVPANVDPRIMDLGMGLLGAIKVYHGSPHKFTKASSEHIGKGEGAQAYGHGLYWAESPETAEQYRRVLSDRTYVDYRRETLNKATAEKYASQFQKMLDDPNFPRPLMARTKTPATDDTIKKMLQSEIEESARATKRLAEFDPGGSLYEANLRWPDAAREASDPLGPQHFLDWDKPYSEQGIEVKNSIQKMLQFNDKQIREAADIWLTSKPGTMGADAPFLYGSLKKAMSGPGKYGSSTKTAKEASDFLNKLGVPGITYLDAGSRAAGQGTRNYVTFDDALVELLKRNGISLAGQ